ncbi:DUF2339 domain-containing protein [Enterovibrio sp. ZSDZ42]|uniref:DUF2339 domain-containing protein n=1 Tax=Enterovibrio gelatinilyticus TaxID=2899819 RepID=A0ABT5R7A6_9GAMM|nr:DUF2339 domain-containing protein [Enterovibrio sp. ZSDZ42]MDD1796153.1 DUF2339 domain-containing protein [Enterovibrio sp. ZSDZ42]
MDLFILIAVVFAVVAMITAVKASKRTYKLEQDLSDLRAELTALRASFVKAFGETKSAETKPLNDIPEHNTPLHEASDNEEHAISAKHNAQITEAIRVTSHSIEQTAETNSDHQSELSSNQVADAQSTVSHDDSAPLQPLAENAIQAENAPKEQHDKEPLSNTFDRGIRKLETSFRENWLVWMGALAMLIGGGYLIQVIGSRIEFSPLMRVAIAFSLSAVTIIAGEFFHRKEQKNSERAARSSSFTYVPAAITGTGITGIYCTVIFAFVFYQLLAPSTSLFILAIAAFASLALSLRQGPLMAVLGLVGGYTAPFWIGGSDPNYFLLAGYITSVTTAGTVLMQRVKRSWLAPSVSVPHTLWMLLLIESIPQQQVFSWVAIFLSITAYLLFAVPRLGWSLNLRYRHCQTPQTNHPVLMSLAMVVLLLWSVDKMTPLSGTSLISIYVFLATLLWLPALRRGVSLRIFYPSTLVISFATLLLSFGLLLLDLWLPKHQLLLCLGASIMLIAFRTLSQFANGDRSIFARVMLITLAPALTILTLGFVRGFIAPELEFWSIFTVLLAGLYVQLAVRIPELSQNISACIHGMVLSLSFVWLNDSMLTTAISAQVALMALQAQYQRFQPAYWAIKVAMGVLVVRLTLLPFVPDWQPTADSSWTWTIVSYLPSLVLLGYARFVLRRVNTDISNWFEGAFLHVFLIALFTQTNYWLTGQYGIITHLDFTSAIVYANQALVMALVYAYRSRFADKLSFIYRGYSILLLIAFAALVGQLNVIFSPLFVNTVSATALPVFNMMALGWLLPGSILLGQYFCRIPCHDIPPRAFAISGIALFGVWLIMSIRQFWQTSSMTIFNTTSMAEMFTYSITGLIVGAVLTWIGVTRAALQVQRIGLMVLGGVTLKVFLLDISFLEGFWRAISFLGLGAALIALGWLFQTLNKSVAEKPKQS